LADIGETKVQGVCLIRGRNYIHWVHPRFLVGSAFRLSGLCCVVFLLFVCLRPVSSAPNVASVSVLSIHDCPFVFSNVYLHFAIQIDCGDVRKRNRII